MHMNINMDIINMQEARRGPVPLQEGFTSGACESVCYARLGFLWVSEE